MEDQERKLKASLEGFFSRPGGIANATWRHLRKSGAVREYLEGSSSWDDLVGEAEEKLDYQDDLDRERSGGVFDDPSSVASPVGEEGFEKPIVKRLSKETKARAEALSEFYALRTGDDTPTEAMTVKLGAGGPPVDGDSRWVVRMDVQAWVSPEEVCDVFRTVRDGLLEEKERIQAKPSTLEIATFVWRQQRKAVEEGRDLPSLTTLRDLWLQNHPGDKRVRGHGDFPRYFRRATNAIIPRYRKILFPLPPHKKAEFEAMKQRMTAKLDKLGEKIGKDVPLIKIPPPRKDS